MTRSLPIVLLLGICTAVFALDRLVTSGGGLRGQYRVDREWGSETRDRIDRDIDAAAINRAWRYTPPERFRAEWTGFLIVRRPGTYTIATTSDDGSMVAIDGLTVVDNSGEHSPRERTGQIRLTTGAHPIAVQYTQSGAGIEMVLEWARGDAGLSKIPSWVLWTSPVTSARALAARIVGPLPAAALLLLLVAILFQLRSPLQRRLARSWPHIDGVLILVLLFAAYFRFQYVDLPLADAHGWRQIFNADVARNFNEISLNIWRPQVSWGGAGSPDVSMEFPLLSWIAAVFFRFLGERDIICRLIAIVFSMATIAGIYGLAASLWGRAVGRAAAFFLAISPSMIFFGRAFISDTPMVCFSVFGVWGFSTYLRTGRLRALVWGAVATGLACMVKLPAAVIFGPIAWLAWEKYGFGALRQRALVAGIAGALLMTVGWYAHAELVFQRTELGVAIFHAVGAYPPDVMEGAGPLTLVTSWNTKAQLSNPDYYWALLDRFWHLHYTPVGFILVIAGAILWWRAPGRRFVDVWFLSVLSFILLAAEGNRWHEFYQLPIMLPSALYFGLAAQRLFDWAWLGRLAPYRLAVAGCAAALVVLGLRSFQDSQAVPELFRPNNLRLRPIRVGARLEEIAPPDALLVTTEYERFGGNSPVLLYYARRRGWSLDSTSLTPVLLDRLRTKFGARYFVTLMWSELEQQRPEVAAYLKRYEEIPVAASDVALFKLQ